MAILWLFGPPGVGKSVVGWELYSRLVALGRPCGFVDIDQLGMCYPAPESDPQRHQLKADQLGAVAAGFADAGVRGLIVAGVLDSRLGHQLGPELSRGTTLLRLRAEPVELRRRLEDRGVPPAAVEEALRAASALEDVDFAESALDTTERTVDQVVEDVASRLGTWPVGAPSGQPADVAVGVPVPGPVLWLWGTTGVGKSTVGFRAYLDLLERGVPAAFVDVDQIGFCSTAPFDHRLRARLVAAFWSRCRSAGAEALIAVGPVDTPDDARLYREALSSITWCGLGVESPELERRVLSRASGGSWAQPGDPLRGRSVTELRRVAATAARQAEATVGPGTGARVQTDGMSVAQEAAAVLASWSRAPTGRSV